METTTKKQVSPTFPRKEWAEDWKTKLVRSDDTVHEIAAPWDKWTVEQDGNGWWSVWVKDR